MSETGMAVYEFRGYMIVHVDRHVYLDTAGQPSAVPCLFDEKGAAENVIEMNVHPLLTSDWKVVRVEFSWT